MTDPKYNLNTDGSYMNEDEIVADIFQHRLELETIRLLHYNFRPPKTAQQKKVLEKTGFDSDAYAYAAFGRWIRNAYGLWAADNPHTKPLRPDGYAKHNGVVTDPRHPDNMAGRIIDQLVTLAQETIGQLLERQEKP